MEVKGTAVMAIREFVKKNHGERYEEWVNGLNDDSKIIFSDYIDSSKWYPVAHGAIEPTKHLSNLFYERDFKNGAWESGRYSAEKGLTGIYKLYVKASTPIHIISRASRIFAAYYQPCKMELADKSDKSVSVVISQIDNLHDIIKYRIGGWIQKALEISGTKNVQVEFNEKVVDGKRIFNLDMSWD